MSDYTMGLNLRADTVDALKRIAKIEDRGFTVVARRVLEAFTKTGHADPANVAEVAALVEEHSEDVRTTAKRIKNRVSTNSSSARRRHKKNGESGIRTGAAVTATIPRGPHPSVRDKTEPLDPEAVNG